MNSRISGGDSFWGSTVFRLWQGAAGIMNLRSKKMWLWSLVIISVLCVVGTQSYAHRHGQSMTYSERGYEQAGREHGGEATGVIAAWLFGIANFPVALSILLKAGGKTMPQGSNLKKTIEQANRQQRRYLMNLHYWLNPIAAAVAIFHFSAVECKSTLMPELGLGMMLLIILLGLIMSFRLSPSPIKKAIFRLHTSPISLMVAISILIIGHSMIH